MRRQRPCAAGYYVFQGVGSTAYMNVAEKSRHYPGLAGVKATTSRIPNRSNWWNWDRNMPSGCRRMNRPAITPTDWRKHWRATFAVDELRRGLEVTRDGFFQRIARPTGALHDHHGHA
jgi:hypothetical protein